MSLDHTIQLRRIVEFVSRNPHAQRPSQHAVAGFDLSETALGMLEDAQDGFWLPDQTPSTTPIDDELVEAAIMVGLSQRDSHQHELERRGYARPTGSAKLCYERKRMRNLRAS